MESLDPKAELMALADTYAVRNREQDEGDSGDSYDAVVESRAALRTAITLALAAERRRALEEAAKECISLAERSEFATEHDRGCCADCTEAICALIDGKAGGT